MIPIFEPYLCGNEGRYLNRCLETTWISSQGEYILEFEAQLAAFHGRRYAIVTSSCTTALHLSLLALNVGPGDEVICPDLTFIAPANMILLAGARPVLVDVDPETLAIDPDGLVGRVTERTRAIIVVHQFGHAAPMGEIQTIAGRCGIPILEDNAESIGGKYRGRLLGSIGDVACLSFFANKIITTGEGGAVLTDRDDLAERCRILRDHGMSREVRYHHVEAGFNYRMTNLQAAIGLAQLEKLNEILALRKRQMELYYGFLEGVSGIALRQFKDWCDPVHWLMTVTLASGYSRDRFLAYMKSQGVDCRQMVNPVHRAEHFAGSYCEEDYPNATRISMQSVHLPSSTHLRAEQIEFISEKVKAFCALGHGAGSF